ncbi:armadillo-type protein [Lentinula edodes]|nr:armadillo-type protein [Lentinula edodes]
MEKFDSISKEKDGRTLIQVIRLVFEKATDEATWSEMIARLCRKMTEQIRKPTAGGNLFRKYLLNKCQEDFERGWFNKEATAAAAAATKAIEEQALKAANTTKEKAKRLGLIKFIGELFKLQMLTERIMYECVKKLLGNVENPEEEEIESLCQLLITVGQMLDTPKACAHMNVYFDRMKELTKSTNDVIELSERKWQQRNAVAAPTTIAKIHEAVTGADGWTVTGNAPRPPAKVGDLFKFRQISKGAPMTFGPSSVFAGKEESKRESLSRTNSNANMFQMLQNVETAEVATKTSRPPSRKPST